MDYRMLALADVKQHIDPSKVLSFDTETDGLYGKIRLAQFYQEHWESPILVEWPNPFELVSLLDNQHFIGHNIHYDITTIQDNLGRLAWVPKNFDCTFLLARLHFFLKDSFSLDNVVKYVLGDDVYANADFQKSDWGAIVLSDEQLQYAAKDSVYTLKVYEVVKAKLDDYCYKLDLLTLKYCLDFQCNGLPLDIGRLEARYIKNNERIKEINLPINCNSYQQVRAYIGSVASNDEGLARLSVQGDEKAKAVREARKLVKNNSFLNKYQKTMEDFGNGHGAIFGKFKLGARSGRLTSDEQNLQQLPRSHKELFGVAEYGDEVLYFVDFAQIQLRNVCVVTGDKTMEALFREGKDMHSFVAGMIFGQDFTKEHRQISKTANFGLLFGAGVQVFIKILITQASLWLPEEEAARIKSKWIKLWQEIAAWQKKGIKDWKDGKPGVTPLGRRYTAEMMTDQLAMEIQGFEAEVAKLALHYMYNELKARNVKLRNFVHDSFIFTGPNKPEEYKEICTIIANAMQEAWKQMCQGVKITDLPMPVNVRVGFNWGDIEKDKFIMEHKQ